MKKIVIAIPENKDGFFKISFNGPSAKRKNPVLVFNWAKRKVLLASQVGAKKVVMIKDGSLVVNESCPSKNASYLLWITLSFLEDYLPHNFYLEKEKLYVGSEP